MIRKYYPSNGTEGDYFISRWCMNCIHEQWLHDPENDDAKKCDILSSTMIYNYKDPEYPSEWQYDENDKPCCTAFSKWDLGRDDGDGLNEPPPPEPYNPNQLVLPFIVEETLKQKLV